MVFAAQHVSWCRDSQTVFVVHVHQSSRYFLAAMMATKHSALLPADIAITRSLYDIAHDMAYRLVFSHVDDANPPSLAGAAQADASTSAMPALPMSIQVLPVI